MTSTKRNRRAIISGLGMAATTVTLGARGVQAQGASSPFTPARHEQDAWMAAMPGKHRVVLDVVTPEAMPDGIRFAGNLFNGHKSGYGVEESEMALIMVLRHTATIYGFNDAMWAKYGKGLDPKATPTPTANPYNSGERMQLSALAKRGVRFMICGAATRAFSGRIAGQGGDVDAVVKDISSNLIPSARIVSAGVVGVTHAQEYGFTLLYVG
jgi:intracellular sulfur oxidation DsrE/DsrF family protein